MTGSAQNTVAGGPQDSSAGELVKQLSEQLSRLEGAPVTTDHSQPSQADIGAGDGRQAILDDIDRTREQLGETVEALAAKADVKAQAKQKATEVQAQAKQKATEVQAEARQKATEVAGTARRQASRAVAAAGQHPQRVAAAAAAAAGAALLAGLLVIRKLRR